jgi:hypothetical protein
MADFNPDAYLAKKSPPSLASGGFDPDAYLSSQVSAQRTSREVPQLDETGAPIRLGGLPSEPEQSRGILDYAVGVPETALALGTGIVGSAVAPFVAAGREILSGQYGSGTPETEKFAEQFQRRMTYQPTSQTGQQMTGAIGETMQGLGLEAIPFAQGLQAGVMAPAALRQGARVAGQEAGYLKNAVAELPAIQARNETRVAQSYQAAPVIDATNLAQKYDIAVDPAISNPTFRNRARDVMLGQDDIADKISQQNLSKWPNIVKEELGVPKSKTLNAATFDEMKAAPELTNAYDAVRAAPVLMASDDVLSRLDGLRAQVLVGDVGSKAAKKLNNALDDIKAQIQQGVDGNKALSSIQDLRTGARNIYKADKIGAPISNVKRRLAQLQDSTADVLENMIETNLRGDTLANYQAARAKYAQIYSAEAATDILTGKVDPSVFAKMVRDGRPLTGALADLGAIAGNFPEAALMTPTAKTAIPRFTRGAVGGAAGAIVGGALGGPAGAIAGTAAGAGISDLLRQAAVRNMMTPGYQSRRAVPKDYRPQVNALRPVEPGQSNIVPFDPRNNPNFVMPENETTSFRNNPNRPDARQPMQETAPMQPAGSNALRLGFENDPQGSITIDRARQLNIERNAKAQGFREADERAPTRGGIQYDFDPITGRLQPTSRGLPGASLDVVEYANKNLTSAAQKLSRSQTFELTAAEKVAFDRTKIDLAIIDPKFKSLSDKEIAAKMFERSSVEDLIQKAKDQAIGFEEIARRSNDQKLIFDANANRQRMLDLAEDLEANLSAPRAKEAAKVKGQGPKTREAITNRLRGGDNVNNLRE